MLQALFLNTTNVFSESPNYPNWPLCLRQLLFNPRLKNCECVVSPAQWDGHDGYRNCSLAPHQARHAHPWQPRREHRATSPAVGPSTADQSNPAPRRAKIAARCFPLLLEVEVESKVIPGLSMSQVVGDELCQEGAAEVERVSGLVDLIRGNDHMYLLK